MSMLQRLDRLSDEFPPTSQALNYPNGLLAVGGDLSEQRLLSAYRLGIFPWYEAPQPIMWWSPNPRSVLFPEELHVSRSLRRTLRRDDMRVSTDLAFHQVVEHCARPRAKEVGTWISSDMARAYAALHNGGHAHSLEVWDANDQLVGGLYGIAMGRVFFGESMFSNADDASKVALVALVHYLRSSGFALIDCQVESPHLNSMGARNIPRLDFERQLAQTVDGYQSNEAWALEMRSGQLL